MPYNHNRKLTPLAKTLRKKMTAEERKLWYMFLRDFPIRFLRQKVIDRYIVDFYCSKAKLVLELDGSQHFEEEAEKKDENRTLHLERLGLKVIRITNKELHTNFQAVCEHIHNVVYARIKQANPSVLPE